MPDTQLKSYQHKLLLDSLHSLFGEFDEQVLLRLEPNLLWIELDGGELLYKEGSPGDSVYFVISGRLQMYHGQGQERHTLGEVIRGETVGEMDLIMHQPRMNTVAAIRDSVLVKMSKDVFVALIKDYPKAALRMTQLIIVRLRRIQSVKTVYKKPINICLLPLQEGGGFPLLAEQLIESIIAKGSTYVATAEAVQNALAQDGVAYAPKAESYAYRRVTQWLDEQETRVEFMLYVADAAESEWTKRCLRQADQVLLIAEADEPAHLSAIEKHYEAHKPLSAAHQILVMLHAPDLPIPRHTAKWLKQRPWVHAHYHIRKNNLPDVQRLARVLSGTAIGLVLAGGGARGFAQLGVLKALEEYNIPIDYVGGTSVGGLMAAAMAFGRPAAQTIDIIRKGAFFNPTKDLNWWPSVSLVSGRRIEKMIRMSIKAFTGRDDVDMADTWRTLYVVSSNYSKAKEQVHTMGSMCHSIMASTAIPGVFPPVIQQHDLLVDGGSFNNFPVDVMRRLGVTKVIGIDRFPGQPQPLALPRIPSAFELFKDRFRPAKRKKYHLPSLMSIMLTSISLYSDGRRKENEALVDMYFNPPVHGFGLVQWKAVDKIAEVGYVHAKAQLEKMSADELDYFRR